MSSLLDSPKRDVSSEQVEVSDIQKGRGVCGESIAAIPQIRTSKKGTNRKQTHDQETS